MKKQRARVSLALVGILFVAAALGIALDAASTPDDDALLTSHLPPPQRVYIQRYSGDSTLGNVLVIVELSPEQKALKDAEGKAQFVTFGKDQQIILRDDGRGGDEIAGDGLYTGIAYVSEAELQQRAQSDQQLLTTEGSKQTPVFEGRTITHYKTQEAFNYSGFSAGQRVPLDPAVIQLEPEDSNGPTATQGDPSGTVATATSIIPPPPGLSLPAPTPSPGVTNVFQERVLIIRTPNVVLDPARTFNPCTNTGTPNGVWTFNHLVTEMANQPASGIDPAVMVESWLETWTSRAPDPVVNSITVPDREQMTRIIDQWPRTTAGTLDLNRSPLRLLAILPRVDLRRTTGGGGGYGGGASGDPIDAGELRFIFGFVLPPGWSDAGFGYGGTTVNLGNGCRALPFTVIFEYGVPACDCFGVVNWASRWFQLRNLDPVTAAYKTQLAGLTERVVRANADPRKPNGSAINQIRTNEVALDRIWELREFQLTQQAFSLLGETTTADTPADPFNNTVTVRNWMLGMVQPLLTSGNNFEDPVPLVPLFFGGGNFLGAHPQVPDPPFIPAVTPPNTFYWTAPNLANLSVNGGMNAENWARHRVSRATCNSCHMRETNTQFLHVSSLTPAPAAISGFLSGINNIADPAEAGGNPRRHFDDLLRREQDIKAVSKVNCFRFHPINKAHVKATLASTGALPADLFQGMTRVPVEQRPAIGVADMNRKRPSEVH